MKNKKIIGFFAAGIALVTFATVSCVVSSSEPRKPANIKGNYSYAKEYLTWLIKKTMDEYHIKGMSIALVDDQNIILEKGFGYADVENKIPATKDTAYRIGSISKLFTGIAVMQLYEQGKIDIDKPLKTYIPEFSIKAHFDQSKYPPITPRNLLTHHSGLFCDLEKGISSSLDQQPSEVSLLDYLKILKNEYTSTPANLAEAYSNFGFVMLGMLVEKVTGQNFSDYVDKNIFQKLNMQRTSFGLPKRLQDNLAKGYAGDEEYKEKDSYSTDEYPSGAIRSSVSDMAQFLKAIFANGGNILKPETLNLMLTPQNKTPLDFDSTMGLAFKLDLTSVVASYHGGIYYPFFGTLMVLPKYKIGVIFLCNSLLPVSRISKLFEAIDNIEPITIKALELAYEVKTGKPFPQPSKQTFVAVTTLSEDELRNHVGCYNVGGDHDLAKITFSNGKLYMNLENKKYRLIPRADGTFSLREYVMRIIPRIPKEYRNTLFSFKTLAGYDVIARHEKNKKELWGVKLNLKPIPEAWRRRVGTYEVINAAESAEKEEYPLVIENDMFFWNKILANPISDTIAVVPTGHAFTLGGTTLQVIKENGEEIILFSGQKLKKKKISIKNAI
jgi:CubicO group peptidase (beta-lactamase class C family)